MIGYNTITWVFARVLKIQHVFAGGLPNSIVLKLAHAQNILSILN
jgi:hypothetical protein